MDPLDPKRPIFGSTAFPDAQTELRLEDSDFWAVRRPYPIDVPCPVCGSHARCDFFGRQRCPHGHLFGQRAFWSGETTRCCLLLEDVRDGRTLIFTDLPLLWRDDARFVPRPYESRPTGA